MIHIKKKNNYKLLIILSAVMAALIAGYFLLVNLLPEQTEQPEPPKYDQLPWEGTSQRVFPDVDTKNVDYITLEPTEGVDHLRYGLIKTEDGGYSLWYQSEKGSDRLMEYNPDIVSKNPAFTYSSLYATDSFGQGKVARLYYLRVALTTMYFSERISLDGLTPAERRGYLEEFGFVDSDGKELGVKASYGEMAEDSSTSTETHRIWIGGQTLSEDGYYVIVDWHKDDGRGDYIYATKTDTIGYATKPYTYYINPGVISAGLASDAAYEPYLIDDYHQWRNEVDDKEGNPIEIDSDIDVIIYGDVSLPQSYTQKNESGLLVGGLIEHTESTNFHIEDLRGDVSYKRLLDLLRAQTVSGFVNAGTENQAPKPLASPLYITLIADGRNLSFGEAATLTQEYEILEIVSAITAGADAVSGKVPVDATALRVKYNLYSAGGTAPMNAAPLYGVISLDDSRLPDDFKATLCAQDIGVSLENANIGRLIITYDKENTEKAHKREIEICVADIIAITDADGKALTKITKDCYVTYRFYLKIDGKKQETYFTARDGTADMDEATRKLFISFGGIKEGVNKEIRAYTEYFDITKDYISYEIVSIPYIVQRVEEVVHFKFLNYSERKPFYGESIYKNLLEDNRKLYGLNNSSCQNVLLHLGGAGTSTQSSNGYTGSETVAVGLTPENMLKYGLYANTIRYVLPRGIGGLDGDNVAGDDEMDDFIWKTTLAFTVYISEKQLDGSRYMASDLYDVVVRVEDEKLDFVEYSFVDFWARQLLVSVDIDDIESLKVEFNFSDKKGDFNFKPVNIQVDKDNSRMYLLVAPGAVTFDNVLSNYMKQIGMTPNGETAISLIRLYNELGPDKYKDAENNGVSHIGNDYTGTHFFKELLGIMYSTLYAETYDEGAQEKILEGECLARLSFKLKGVTDKYVYEFYRASDRRVLVRICRETPEGVTKNSVSDFSITTAVFKKIMGGFNALVNAGEVDTDMPYFD